VRDSRHHRGRAPRTSGVREQRPRPRGGRRKSAAALAEGRAAPRGGRPTDHPPPRPRQAGRRAPLRLPLPAGAAGTRADVRAPALATPSRPPAAPRRRQGGSRSGKFQVAQHQGRSLAARSSGPRQASIRIQRRVLVGRSLDVDLEEPLRRPAEQLELVDRLAPRPVVAQLRRPVGRQQQQRQRAPPRPRSQPGVAPRRRSPDVHVTATGSPDAFARPSAKEARAALIHVREAAQALLACQA